MFIGLRPWRARGLTPSTCRAQSASLSGPQTLGSVPWDRCHPCLLARGGAFSQLRSGRPCPGQTQRAGVTGPTAFSSGWPPHLFVPPVCQQAGLAHV